jgi:hypothetical protein
VWSNWSAQRSGQLSDRRSGTPKKPSSEGRQEGLHVTRRRRPQYDRARQIAQLVALVIDEAIKLIGVLRGGR